MGYARSPVRVFESYLRTVIELNEDDIQSISKPYNANFVTHGLSPGIYTIKDISEAVYTMGDQERTLKSKIDDISMKTKLSLTRFGGTSGTLRFDEKWFFITLPGFTPFWDYETSNAIHADSPGVYTSDNILSLGTKNKIHLKGDVIDGSIADGIRDSIFSFIFDKPAGYKVFYEPETIIFEKSINLFCIL